MPSYGVGGIRFRAASCHPKGPSLNSWTFTEAVVDLRFRLRPKQLTAAKPKVAGPAPRAGAKGEEAQDAALIFEEMAEFFDKPVERWCWCLFDPSRRVFFVLFLTPENCIVDFSFCVQESWFMLDLGIHLFWLRV